MQLARTKSAYCNSMFSAFGEAQQLHSFHRSNCKDCDRSGGPLGDETVDKSATSMVGLPHVLLPNGIFKLVNHCHVLPLPVTIQKQSSINVSFTSHVRPACRRSWKISCIRANLCATIICPTHSRANTKQRTRYLTACRYYHHYPNLIPSVPCRMLAEHSQNSYRICRLNLGLRIPHNGSHSQ